MIYKVWEKLDDEFIRYRQLGNMEASNMIDAIKAARRVYPLVALRVSDDKYAVEFEADAGEPDAEFLEAVMSQ